MYLDGILLSGILRAWHWSHSRKKATNVIAASTSGSREKARSASRVSVRPASRRTGISRVNTNSSRGSDALSQVWRREGGSNPRPGARPVPWFCGPPHYHSGISPLKAASGEDVSKRLTPHLQCKNLLYPLLLGGIGRSYGINRRVLDARRNCGKREYFSIFHCDLPFPRRFHGFLLGIVPAGSLVFARLSLLYHQREKFVRIVGGSGNPLLIGQPPHICGKNAFFGISLKYFTSEIISIGRPRRPEWLHSLASFNVGLFLLVALHVLNLSEKALPFKCALFVEGHAPLVELRSVIVIPNALFDCFVGSAGFHRNTIHQRVGICNSTLPTLQHIARVGTIGKRRREW
jgi:hypothetical protein